MKKNKGFTLIELLAIIVILAIIAVITVPIILNIIENSKKGAATDSAYGYKEAIGKYYASQLSQNSDFMLNGEYTINSNGSISDSENNYPILISGTAPNSGYVTIEKGIVTAGCIQINEYAVTIEDRKVTNTEKGNCTNTPSEPVEVVVEEFQQVTDDNPGIICGNGDTEDYDNSTVCYIYSVEDLVAFSNMVNSGKNFSGKTVQLMNNLDIKNDKSYVNPSTNQFGDINENSTTSETLKEELTIGKGFKPIGTDSSQFKGTFEGNTKKIKNLLINRPSENYIGLFGKSNGYIRGLKIENAEVTGNNYVGIVSGYNYKNATSLIVSGNVTGNKDVGLAVGSAREGTVEAVVEGNVTSTFNTAGSDANVGGIVGYTYTTSAKVYGIYKNGTVSVTNGNAYRAVGKYNQGSSSVIVSTDVTAPSSDSGINKLGGTALPLSSINNIGTMERVLDTYVGGDKDVDDYSDGYYYDNDENGNITIYSTAEHPLVRTMDGSGTSGDPYIITNYQQLKEASYDVTKCYRLAADIDMTGKNAIMLAGINNKFTGIFDGGAHTISNMTIRGYSYLGLFGYTNGQVRGLKLENINIIGVQHIGLVSGYNYKNITSIIAKGNVSGYKDLGLAVGNAREGTVEAVVQGNVTSTFNTAGSDAEVGGIVGYTYTTSAKIYGIHLGGTVSVTNGNAYRAVGKQNQGSSSVIVSNVTAPSSETGISNLGGTSISQANINGIAAMERVLDTYIGGDKDVNDYSDGYYYDNDENGNITIYSVLDRPLTRTMDGSGTSGDPYLITNYNQLKEASYDVTKCYRLEADISMQGKNAIMLSGVNNKFTGVFDGNTHTISDATIRGYSYVGLFGYNKGTIKGLKVNNINAIGTQYVGLITGYNMRYLTNTIAYGNVTGYMDIGLAAGYTREGTVQAVVEGNVTSTYNTSGSDAHVGGITGYIYYAEAKVYGIYKGGEVKVTNGNVNRTIGFKNSGTIKTGALNTIIVNNSTRSSTSTTSTDGKSYTASELQTLTPYAAVELNTSSTSGEYRYELDLNNNICIVKN